MSPSGNEFHLDLTLGIVNKQKYVVSQPSPYMRSLEYNFKVKLLAKFTIMMLWGRGLFGIALTNLIKSILPPPHPMLNTIYYIFTNNINMKVIFLQNP